MFFKSVTGNSKECLKCLKFKVPKMRVFCLFNDRSNEGLSEAYHCFAEKASPLRILSFIIT